MEINNFDIIKEMSLQNNQSFKLFPASNVEQVSTRKGGWGFVKMAIDNLTADQIMSEKNLFIGLFVYNWMSLIESKKKCRRDNVMIIRYCTECKIDPQELFKDRMICPICGGKKTGFFDALPIEHSDVDEAIINLSINNAIFGTKDDE